MAVLISGEFRGEIEVWEGGKKGRLVSSKLEIYEVNKFKWRLCAGQRSLNGIR